jgi:hypothetical protein
MWLVEEGLDREATSLADIDVDLQLRSRGRASTYGVSVNDVVVHDNRKWFGEADVRIDALVVHGYPKDESPDSCYKPGTFRFSRVADGDALPIGESGLLLFLGIPHHFLDVFITVARDTKDSDDLANLLQKATDSDEYKTAASGFRQLMSATPTAAMISAGLEASMAVGNLAYRILRQVSSSTIGLYRASWLQQRDRFGEGRHPETGSHRVKDLSFSLEITREKRR